MVFRKTGLSIFERRSCAIKSMFFEKIMLKHNVQQQSGRWA